MGKVFIATESMSKSKNTVPTAVAVGAVQPQSRLNKAVDDLNSPHDPTPAMMIPLVVNGYGAKTWKAYKARIADVKSPSFAERVKAFTTTQRQEIANGALKRFLGTSASRQYFETDGDPDEHDLSVMDSRDIPEGWFSGGKDQYSGSRPHFINNVEFGILLYNDWMAGKFSNRIDDWRSKLLLSSSSSSSAYNPAPMP